MFEIIDFNPETKRNKVSPNLYLKVLAKNWLKKRSFGDSAKELLILSKREWKVSGIENIPRVGPYIVVANHFVRLDDAIRITGPHKMNDFIVTVGLINKLIEENSISPIILWTPSKTPRPEALIPRSKSYSNIVKWLRNDVVFAGANISRTLFLSMYSYSKDILVAPNTSDNLAEFRQYYEGVTNHIRAGGILGIFPEGKISQEMQPAKPGMAHIAIKTHTMVLPFAVYDKNGVLNINIEPSVEPPCSISKKSEFTESVMVKIAAMLPEQLRGYYRNKLTIQSY